MTPAQRAELIEPFPVPELDVVYYTIEEYSAALHEVISLFVAADGASSERFAGWFFGLLEQAELNPQQNGAAKWLESRLQGLPSATGGGWQEKLIPQLARKAAQVRCCATGSSKSGPRTSPQFERMIAADFAIRGDGAGSISAIARDHGISRPTVRNILDRVLAKRDKVRARKLKAEGKRRKSEQKKTRTMLKYID